MNITSPAYSPGILQCLIMNEGLPKKYTHTSHSSASNIFFRFSSNLFHSIASDTELACMHVKSLSYLAIFVHMNLQLNIMLVPKRFRANG